MDDRPATEDLFETAPCGLALLGSDYRFLRVNPYLIRMMGADRAEDLLGRPLQTFVSPASRIFLQTRLLQSLAVGGVVEELALDLVGPDAVRIPVMLNAAQTRGPGDAPGQIRLAVSHAPKRRAYEAEIPKARLQAEAERALSKSVIAAFVQQAPVPLVMTDTQMRVLGVSDRWVEAYGLARSAVVGRPLPGTAEDEADADPYWPALYARALTGERLHGDRPSGRSDTGAGSNGPSPPGTTRRVASAGFCC